MTTNNLQEYFFGNVTSSIVYEPPTHLVCTKCGVEKPTNAFHKNSQTSSGFHAYCKVCRGGKTNKPQRVERFIDSKVWFGEAMRVCPCVVCGAKPVLPNTVSAAKDHLTSEPPLCETHIDASNLKARMAKRSWPNIAEERLLSIEVFHDIKVKFKNVPRMRQTYKAFWAWNEERQVKCSGKLTDHDIELFLTLVEEITRGVVARNESTSHLPKIVEIRRWKTITQNESVSFEDHFGGLEAKHDD